MLLPLSRLHYLLVKKKNTFLCKKIGLEYKILVCSATFKVE